MPKTTTKLSNTFKKLPTKVLYSPSLLTPPGNAAGIAQLGTMYANGYHVAQNNETAVQLYIKAANKVVAMATIDKPSYQGNAQAQTNLGYMYMHGYGVVRSTTEAFKYFKMAADQGYAEGLVNLGSLYYSKGYFLGINKEKRW